MDSTKAGVYAAIVGNCAILYGVAAVLRHIFIEAPSLAAADTQPTARTPVGEQP